MLTLLATFPRTAPAKLPDPVDAAETTQCNGFTRLAPHPWEVLVACLSKSQKYAKVEIFSVCRWERFNVIPAIDLIRSKHSGQRQWCLWATISKQVTENQIILLPLWHEAGGLSKQKGIKMDQRCVHRSHKISQVDRSACTAMPSFAASSASSYLSKSNNAFRENDSLYPW